MSNPTQFMFTHKELATVLVKAQELHEGMWMLSVQFGMAASNVRESENELSPAAIIPLLRVGLQKSEKMNNLTVDAAEVNP